MLNTESPVGDPAPGLPLLQAADLQDHLMVANHDLERLQRLLDDASETLSGHFYGASQHLTGAMNATAPAPGPGPDGQVLQEAMQSLSGAITALQFHDMATQLIAHTQRRLRGCADRIARDAMGEDDEFGAAEVSEIPERPNPVTQDEMDAGSVDLF